MTSVTTKKKKSAATTIVEKTVCDITGITDVDFEVVTKKIESYVKATNSIIKLLQLYTCKDGLAAQSGVVDDAKVSAEVQFIGDLVDCAKTLVDDLHAFAKISITGVTYAQFQKTVQASYQKIRNHRFTSVICIIYRNFVKIFADNDMVVPEDLPTKFDCKKFDFLSDAANGDFNPFFEVQSSTISENKTLSNTISSSANFARLWLPIVDISRKKVLEQYREVGRIILERLFEYSRMFYETMCMLDTTLDAFTCTIVGIINQLKESLGDNGKKFDAFLNVLGKSADTFKNNANKYYRVYITTGNEGSIFYGFITDVTEQYKGNQHSSQIMMQANKFLRMLQDNMNITDDKVKMFMKTAINGSASTESAQTAKADDILSAISYTAPASEKKS